MHSCKSNTWVHVEDRMVSNVNTREPSVVQMDLCYYLNIFSNHSVNYLESFFTL